MFKSFFNSKKWFLWAWCAGFLIICLVALQVHFNVLINQWYREFYDIMQNIKDHKMEDYNKSIVLFLKIAMPYILVATIVSYLTSIYAFKWREAMTFAYITKWKMVEKDIEGSSQRIQEDIYRFAKIVEDMGLKILKAIMVLFSFLPILWNLSQGLELPIFGTTPGSLVWIALLVSIGGLGISWIVGIKLPGLEYNNQKVEAAFRKELVFAEDNKKQYALDQTIFELFTGLKFNYNRLFLHYGYFNIWLNSFSQFIVIMPYMFLGKPLFTGAITLGALIQISNAFSQVRDSFSIFINNWTLITELRSIHKRLSEFEKNIGYK